MTTAQVLRDAKALIADPDDWIKGAMRADMGDRVCHCALGAITGDGTEYQGGAVVALQRALPDELAIVTFNDDPNTTHADVMAAFDRAIAAEEAA